MERIATGGPGGAVSLEGPRGRVRARGCIVTVSTGVLAAGAHPLRPGAAARRWRTAIAGLPQGLLSKIALRAAGPDRLDLPEFGRLGRRVEGEGDRPASWVLWPFGRDHAIGYHRRRGRLASVARRPEGGRGLRARRTRALLRRGARGARLPAGRRGDALGGGPAVPRRLQPRAGGTGRRAGRCCATRWWPTAGSASRAKPATSATPARSAAPGRAACAPRGRWRKRWASGSQPPPSPPAGARAG